MVSSPHGRARTDTDKGEVIKDAFKSARHDARDALLANHPEFIASSLPPGYGVPGVGQSRPVLSAPPPGVPLLPPRDALADCSLSFAPSSSKIRRQPNAPTIQSMAPSLRIYTQTDKPMAGSPVHREKNIAKGQPTLCQRGLSVNVPQSPLRE